ncbi:PREDICTED: tumor necrosis factor receptor superfamily member 16-like isoform X2 [Priapulus caudatus]|uniref:Tumor necrosis factor receptor superfamily member 16-like isoform X2 n=1 Tax=Priapulus caudatus TaxID=37621 RepID=A0ABM1E625_PRICU|nr:PREDICTED: tumor necrosis factor receptor superfamily member 16-like isoform X2 [Priapulus caudatus]
MKMSRHWMVLLALMMAPAVMTDCPDGQYAGVDDRCCDACPAGHGLASPCTPAANTTCEPCTEGLTFSAEAGGAPCRACRTCPDEARVASPCNVTRDSECQCERDYYFDARGWTCVPCDMCSHGYGATRPCGARHNTICRKCRNGTFSEMFSKTDACRPCSVCSEKHIMLQPCEPIQDTICLDKDMPYLRNRPSTPAPSSRAELAPSGGTHDNIIPLYCALLGLVIAGLIVYVAIKRMQIHKHQKAAQATPSPALVTADVEGATAHKRLGSDSGIYMEKEFIGNRQAVTPSMKVRHLPKARKHDLETMLNPARLDYKDWRGLAKELGYDAAAVARFERRSNKHGPLRQLFADWGRLDSAVVQSLVNSLQKIGRYDAASTLMTEQYTHPTEILRGYGERV